MTSDTNNSESVALFIQFKDESDYSGGREFTIDASFCVVPDDGRVYPRGSQSPLNNLHCIIRGGSWAMKLTDGRDAWLSSVSICYNDVHYAGVGEVQAMAKALQAIHRKMDKLSARFGCACDPFEVLGRFADALGADTVYFRNDPETRAATGDDFRARNRTDGLSQVRYEARKMADTLAKQQAA